MHASASAGETTERRERGRRTVLRRFAALAADRPIEVIVRFPRRCATSRLTPTQVAVFIGVTLVYFQLLEAVKASDFLNAGLDSYLTSANIVAPAPALVRRTSGGQWTSVRADEGTTDADVHLRQVVVSLDAVPAPERRNVLVYATDPAAPAPTSTVTASASGLLDPALVEELIAFERSIRSGKASSGSYERELCYRPPGSKQCFAHSLLASSQRDELFPNDRTYVLTLGFGASTVEAQTRWERSLLDADHLESLGKRGAGSASFRPARSLVGYNESAAFDGGEKNRLGFSFSLSPPSANGDGANLREMRSVKWMAYAARAFVLRFWGLARVRWSHHTLH